MPVWSGIHLQVQSSMVSDRRTAWAQQCGMPWAIGKTTHNEESKGKKIQQTKLKEKQKAWSLYPSSCDVKWGHEEPEILRLKGPLLKDSMIY